jgi:HEAT repeat protein
MLDPGSEITMPWPMAFAVILGCVTLAVYFARAYARRQRRRMRQRAQEFARTLAAYLDGKLTLQELRECAGDADTGTFWSALEPFAARMPRPEWLRLSKALAKIHHLAREQRALSDDSPWRGELAARRLSLVRAQTSRRALRKALVGGPELLSYACARALARYGDLRALEWLLAHPDRLRRRSAKQWLALLEAFGPQAFACLIENLPHLRDTQPVERAAIEALGRIGDVSAAAAIEKRLTADSVEVRVSAARALGRMRAAHCVSGLIAALRDATWQVRAQAAWALGRAQTPVAVYALTSRLTDEAWWVRRHAAYALAQLGEDGHTALAHAVQTSDDRYARDIAQEVLSGGILKRSA